MPEPSPAIVSIFYALRDNEHEDPARRWLDRILERLEPLVRRDEIQTFCENDLDPTEDWQERVRFELAGARMVILLVSSTFVNWDCIGNQELPRLLGSAREGGVHLLPVFVRPWVVGQVRFRYPDPHSGPKEFNLKTLPGIGAPQRSLMELPDHERESALDELVRVTAQLLARSPDPARVSPALAETGTVSANRPSRSVASPSPAPANPGGTGDRRRTVAWRLAAVLAMAVVLVFGLRWFRSDATPAAGPRQTNSLGMVFVPVPGTNLRFSVWETRVADFRAFAEATRRPTSSGMLELTPAGWRAGARTWKDPGFEQTDDHPVVGVTLDDARAFCAWLTEKEIREGRLTQGQRYRLPTDPEWSTAVGDARYPWGREWPPPPDAGNLAGSESRTGSEPPDWRGIPGFGDGYPRTAPVGRFRLNRYGLSDLGGNVEEWCEDTQRDRAAVASGGTKSVPTGILRGGSWSSSERQRLRSRHLEFVAAEAGASFSHVGFRCVLAVD